jgi:hypothetical protein
MSDEIFEVATGSVDVAALGQDYSDRVDGDRILLGLPRALQVGEEVRFVVLLLDGTPAFAGAGRAVEVSDQGRAAGKSRYETLVDSLAFDERSQPVYEYIVAVRQLAYQQQTEGAEQAGGMDVDVDHAEGVSAEAEEASGWDADATRVSSGSIPPEAQRVEKYDLDGATLEMQRQRSARASSQPTPVPEAQHTTARPLPEPEEPSAVELPAQSRVQLPTYATIPPEPLKTGILTRKALAAHWAPAAPRPPQRSLRPTGFQSTPGPLAVPAVPPRPALDRSEWVERAPAP